MSSSVEQIKERLSIVDVVGSYINLERSGINYRARCPFHSERTPSFFVSPTRNSYYCFGCGAKGDIFSFVQQFEGLDFKGALYALAEQAGVEVKSEDPEKRDERDKLYSVLEAACIFFQNQLKENKEVLGYLKNRGISNTSVEKWRLGFAPAEWGALYEHLSGQGFSREQILGAGLIKESKSGGKYYDTFRNRIMFPIADSAGRAVAFSGRLFEKPEEEEKEDKPPKYVNTPETVLYNKSNILYGLDKAKHSIRSHNFTIVVEGQMDLLMSHQTEFTNAVAISGTALTNDQLGRLNKLSGNVVVAFDADEAGISSAGRSALRGLLMGMDVKVAKLPYGSDPADLILENKENWRQAIRESSHIVDFYLSVIDSKGLDDRKYRLEVSRQALPFVAAIQSKIDQSHFVSRVASKLHVDEQIIYEELREISLEKLAENSELSASMREGAMQENTKEAQNEASSRKELIERKLFGIILWQESTQEPRLDTNNLRERLYEFQDELDIDIEKLEGKDKEELIYEAEYSYGDNDNLSEEIEEFFKFLKKEVVRSRFNRKLLELKQAEYRGDEEEAEKLRRECQNISEEMTNL